MKIYVLQEIKEQLQLVLNLLKINTKKGLLYLMKLQHLY